MKLCSSANILLFLHLSHLILLQLQNLFMQDPNNSSKARNNNNNSKPWYQRAMEMGTTLWRSSNNNKSTQLPPSPSSSNLDSSINNLSSRHNKLRKCTSLKVATSFTRVCLCAPISSYNEVFRAELPPRRSNSYPRASRSYPNSTSIAPSQAQQAAILAAARLSTDHHQGISRRVFRGKSLTDDVSMRRFVVEEEAMMMQVRRRNQMEVIRRRSVMRRKRLGPSPLRRMVMAQDH